MPLVMAGACDTLYIVSCMSRWYFSAPFDEFSFPNIESTTLSANSSLLQRLKQLFVQLEAVSLL